MDGDLILDEGVCKFEGRAFGMSQVNLLMR